MTKIGYKVIIYPSVVLCLCAFLFSCITRSKIVNNVMKKEVKEVTEMQDIGEKKRESIEGKIQAEDEIGRIEDEGLLEVEAIIDVKDDIEEGGYEDFDSAEDFFKNSQLTIALSRYKHFVDKYKENEFTDDAFYRIGEIFFYLKNYASSLKHFNIIRERFPWSDLYKEAEYYVGLCYFFLEDYTSAIEIFEKILPQRMDKKRLAEIYYFKGKSHYKNKEFLFAVDEFKSTVELYDDDNVTGKSIAVVKEIIENKIKRDEMEAIIVKYPGEFPSDYVLFRLAYYYSGQKDYISAKKSLEELLSEFPQNEYAEEAANWLKGLAAVAYSNEIKIGCILPLSGSAADTGERILRGIRLAFNSFVNKIRDYELRLVIRDSSGDPDAAAAAARELAMIDNVAAIIGPVFSRSAYAVANVADEFRIPVFTPTASADGVPELSKYMFRNCMTNKAQGKAVAEYAVNNLGLKRFVIFYPDNTYGNRLREIFRKNIKRLGAEIAVEQSYPPTANDFGNEIKRLGGMNDDDIKGKIIRIYEDRLYEKFETDGERSLTIPIADEGIDPVLNKDYIRPSLKLGYDAIFIPGYFNKIGLIAPELAFYNISGVKLIGANGWNSPKLIEIGGKYINGSMFVDGFFVNSPDDAVSEFVKNYRNIFQEDPDILSAQSYDAAAIIEGAVINGYITREGIREYLSREVTDYRGISGMTTMLSSGESDKVLYYLEVRNGKIKQIN